MKDLGSGKRGYTATATADGHIRELGAEARATLGIVDEKAYKAWFRLETDVQEGDRLTGDDGKIYQVRETNKQDYGINQHLEVILVEYNE